MEFGSIRIVEDNVCLIAAPEHGGVRHGEVESGLGVRSNDDDFGPSPFSALGVDAQMGGDSSCHLPYEQVDEGQEDQAKQGEDGVGHQPNPIPLRTGTSDDLESVGTVGEGDHRAGSELYGIVPESDAVQPCPVDGAQISQPYGAVSTDDLGVLARDL